MRLLEGILYFEVEEVAAYGVPEMTVKSGMVRARNGGKSWQNIPAPEDGRRKLIDAATIPAATRERYCIPDVKQLRAEMDRQQQHQRDERLRELRRRYEQASDRQWYLERGIDREKATGLAQSAAWLRLLADLRSKTQVRALGLPGIESKGELLQAVFEVIQEDRPHGLHRLDSLAGFRTRTLVKWNKADGNEAQLASLVHGHRKLRGLREGNQNARKISEALELLLLSYYLNPEYKLQQVQVWDEYATLAAAGDPVVNTETGEVLEDLPELSLTSVKSVLNRPKNQMLLGLRHGSKFADDFLRPYIYRRKPQYSLSLASSDGFSFPFWTKTDKGKATWKRQDCYVIFDAKSGAILGAALGEQESAELMKRAFLDMLIRLDYRVPLTNQLDNFAKFFEPTLSKIMGVKFCQPYNAKSKYAEREIENLKYSTLREFRGFIGRHSNKRADNQRNPDLPNPVNGGEGYTLAEQEALLNEAIDRYNHRPANLAKGGPTRWEVYEASINPEAITVEMEVVADAFGIRRENTIRRGFVTVVHQGEQYVYQVPNYTQLLSELSRPDASVRVRFLPHYMSELYLYDYDNSDNPDLDRLLTVAPLAEGVQVAPAEQTEQDLRRYGRQAKAQKQYDREVEERAAELGRWQVQTPDEADAMLQAGITSKYHVRHEYDDKDESTKRIKRW